MKFARQLKVLLIVFTLITISLGSLEVLLAEFRPIAKSNLEALGWRWRESPYRTALMDSGIRGEHFWGPDETNQVGFRGRPISYKADDFVVLLVGDSQVESPASRFEDMPEVILERSLKSVINRNVKVFSVGSSGWSQDQQLLALREYFSRFRADLVLLWFTEGNDYWENAFPDRSTNRVQDMAGHLKPVFILRDQNYPDSYDVELFQLDAPNVATNVLRQFNLGRAILKVLSRFGLFEYENEAALKQWLHLIPAATGHMSVDEKQCPTEKVPLSKLIHDYDAYAARLITVELAEAIEESRSHFTPFLEPRSLRDEYAVRITHALLKQIDVLAEMNRADFKVFAPELRFHDVPFLGGVRCVKRGNQFFRVRSDFSAPMAEWRHGVNFQKLVIEIGAYGLPSLTVDRSDAHLNYFGNELVMEALAKTVHVPLNSAMKH